MSLTDGSVRVSGSVFGNFHCSWSIPNFSTKQGIFESEIARLQDNLIQWYLRIDTGSDGNEGERCICCHLMMLVTRINEGFRVKVQFSLRNIADEILWHQRQDEWRKLEDGEHSWFTGALKRPELIKKLTGDILVISMNVAYCETSRKEKECTTYSAVISPIAKLLQDLESSLMDKENTDTVLSVEEKEIPVHSVLLAARSKVFKAMFQYDMKEKTSRKIEITDFNSPVIDALIEFVYTGNVKFLKMDVALELVRAADKYYMDDLMHYCSEYLVSNLNGGNIVRVIIKADRCNASYLKTEALKYFRACRGREIIQTHRSLLKQHPDVLLDMLEAEKNGDN